MTGVETADPERRQAELRTRLTAVRQRITAASAQASRTEPALIVVTKYFPASDVRILAGLGITDVGENRDQEAVAKAAETAGAGLRWHFIGQLQTNKAKSVVRYADVVHSVDRVVLVDALAKAWTAENEHRDHRGEAPRQALSCFVQVNLGEAATDARGGALPGQVRELATRISEARGLGLAGVMAVAPLGTDPLAAFHRLEDIAAEVRTVDARATGVSAGMSADLEAAIAAGATHLRIGSDVLGPRPPVR
ncbi:YggS family pyridoxal phosphate-dependent enzyme [Arthrobacter sp. Br18]|uniref:YggS family pyridoxal phosphate-dependent enzyme n=1 Tax=Arthrobacter sp. Br18 TaxID=1312954 RepID=UPI000479B75C|nr:YggS family pyridoxal phosphate-dependent enzyme [Arthrobacter sp. Br18]